MNIITCDFECMPPMNHNSRAEFRVLTDTTGLHTKFPVGKGGASVDHIRLGSYTHSSHNIISTRVEMKYESAGRHDRTAWHRVRCVGVYNTALKKGARVFPFPRCTLRPRRPSALCRWPRSTPPCTSPLQCGRRRSPSGRSRPRRTRRPGNDAGSPQRWGRSG